MDACSERLDWETHRDRPAAQTIYGVEVLVEEEQSGARWVTVTDRGIGMAEEVTRNYFLRAGASFRTSDAWRKRHEDDDGRPRIHRGGRFGIGALAAFLVADEIHVTTRHASAAEDRAIAFVANLDGDAIELRYTAAPIGTTIRLPVASESIQFDPRLFCSALASRFSIREACFH